MQTHEQSRQNLTLPNKLTMQGLSLNRPSPLVETVNQLIDSFDKTDPTCSTRFKEWCSAQNGERELPESWRNQLSTKSNELGYFCTETALALVFNAIVASKIDDKTLTTYKELDDWRQKTADRYYTALSEGIYAWPFDALADENKVPVLTTSFNIEEIAVGSSHDVLGKIYHEVFDQEIRKHLGEFYTSRNIINYLLDLSEYKKELWKKRLMDPACGSGSFLISAVERLLETKPDQLSSAEAVYRICDSPLIVGFDINPFACEIARLRLFIKIYPYLGRKSENKIHKLPIFNIDSLARDRTDISDSANQTLAQFTDGGDIREKYIEEFNLQEITSVDTYQGGTTVLNQLLAEYEGDDTRPKATTTFGQKDREAGRILRDNVKYDAVVGNPPYVRIQMIPEDRRGEYKKGFNSATGKFDLSVLFMEYAVESLRDGGEMAFITSNKFLTTQYGEGIRAYLRENTRIKMVIDFTDTDVFDATVLPCILSANKESSDIESLGYCILKQTNSSGGRKKYDELLPAIDQHIGDGSFEGRYSVDTNGESEIVKARCFEAVLPESEDETWTFMSSKERSLVNKIDQKKSTDLGSIAEKISVGVKTTANNVFVDPITDSKIEEYNLEEELIRPAISGKNVSRWSVDWSPEDLKKPSYILYPHEVVNGSIKAVNLDNYPNAKKYLEEHYEQLAGRSYLEDAGRDWYECWVPQHPDYFDVKNKIITPEMATRNSFALDTTGLFCIGSCYSILLKEDSPLLYRYLTGLLNSDLVEFYLKAHSSTQLYADRFRYNKSYIENLPVLYVNPSTIDNDTCTTKDPDSVEETMVYISSLVKQLDKKSSETKSVEKRINKMVYKLFDITEEEKEIIQQHLEFTSSD